MESDSTAGNLRSNSLRVHYHLKDVPQLQRAYAGDAGLDLTAMRMEQWRPSLFAFDCGLSVQPPKGCYCEVVARSGLCKQDFILANGVGVIDSTYRGAILVVLRYLGHLDEAFAAAEALKGQRIAQLLVRRLEEVWVERVASLDETARGEGGFGSSGK